MRIRAFSVNIEFNELHPYELKNCDVVIDGQNYFFNMYQQSGMPFEFGCESNKYAQYLRERLAIFKKANVKCYLFFKGGDSDIECNAISSKNEDSSDSESETTDDTQNNIEVFEDTQQNIVQPIFMKEVYKEVLDEMNFNYVICEFECKRQCIALAQKLKCPVLSFDIEYCFSGVPYIPTLTIERSDSLRYDDTTCSIHCSIFNFKDFVQKYKLSKEKLATFIVLTDESILPQNYFQKVYLYINIKSYGFRRNLYLLRWLSSKSNESIAYILQECLQPEEIANFATKINKIMEFICRIETPEIPFDYLMQENQLDFDSGDPLWFQKGVACGNVALRYVNIYRWNTVSGSWCIEDPEAEDALFLSLDIIKYAYNLLTNFERSELQFHNNKGEVVSVNVADATAISKPSYSAEQSPFENGWAQIRALRLFEHFLENSMKAHNFNRLKDLPEDVKLLIIALVYFTQKKSVDTTVTVCSVLLSYVMLEVVANKCNNNVSYDDELVPKPILDHITDKEQVTELDSNLAVAALTRYFTVSTSELNAILDLEMLHPLVEFQHCLQQLNFLNKLCGAPYRPTTYSRTYNGTFVYKVAHAIKTQYSGNVIDFVEKHLSPAPTVLAFFNGLKEVFEEVMYQ